MEFEWLSKLSHVGVQFESDSDIRRRITFSNIVFLTMPAVYLLFMILDYKSYLNGIENLRFDQFIVPIEIATCFLCLLLNTWKKTRLSRIIFLVSWPLLLHILPIILLQTPPDYYLAFPIGVIFHAIVMQVMISQRREPFLFWTFIGMNFVTMLFSFDILFYFDTDTFSNTGVLTEELFGSRYYVLDGVLYWSLFNLLTFYMIRSIEKYISKINTSRREIESQRQQLNKLNINLEQIVDERTVKLKERNQRLQTLAFYNAHLLRGPFCRITGLLQLQKLLGDSEAERVEIESKLEFSIEELSMRIAEIQQIADID
ncbi:MAG TPA: hypothetical protein VK666_14520 [Chryseolinea sp.]|nr:hypothetical protein [Chryseolinea sp.]